MLMNMRSFSRFAKAAVSLELFLSVAALGGGVALMLGPRVEIVPLPLSETNEARWTDQTADQLAVAGRGE